MPTQHPGQHSSESDGLAPATENPAAGRATDRDSRPIVRTSGKLTGSYEADYLDRLRDDWPA